jgi:hypothetical protein
MTAPETEGILIPTSFSESPKQKSKGKRFIAIGLALTSSLTASALVFLVGSIFSGASLTVISKNELIPVLATFVIGSALLIPITLLKLFKESQEETRPTPSVIKYFDIENAINQTLERKNIPVELNRKAPYDFCIKSKEGTYLLELQPSLSSLSRKSMQELITQLEQSAISLNASSFLVSLEPISDKTKEIGTKNVKIIGMDELNTFLNNLPSN